MPLKKFNKLFLVGALTFVLLVLPISALWSQPSNLTVPSWGGSVTSITHVIKQHSNTKAGTQYSSKGAVLPFYGNLTNHTGNINSTYSMTLTGEHGVSTADFIDGIGSKGRPQFLTVVSSGWEPATTTFNAIFTPDYQ